jgi:hypothetical protein
LPDWVLTGSRKLIGSGIGTSAGVQRLLATVASVSVMDVTVTVNCLALGTVY